MQKLRRGPAYARVLLEEFGEGRKTPKRAANVHRIASILNLELREVDADGFDGSLIRAKDLPLGAIVVRQSIRETSRKNFTIAHELGHFLLPGHQEADAVCGSNDIGNWGDASKALEREADEFAAELLMPASVVQPIIRSADPSLQTIEKIARQCGSSLSAAAWRYCDLTRERCAVVWSMHQRIQWSKRSRYFGFRFKKSAPVQPGTFAFECFDIGKGLAEPRAVSAKLWIGSKNLSEGAQIWEQSKSLPRYASVLSLLWIKERRTANS
jgi:hypothetical protein